MNKPIIPERGKEEREKAGLVTLGELISVITTTDMKAVCETHGEYQASGITIGDKLIASICPGCIEDQRDRELRESAAARAQDRAEARQRGLAARIATAGIPARFRACNFENFRVTEGVSHTADQRTALRTCRHYAKHWVTMRERGQVLVLTGSTGTGKTHLSCAVANAVMTMYGATVAFGTVADHMMGIKAAFQPGGAGEQAAIRSLVEPDLLVMDEIGQRMSEFDQQSVFNVINARYAEMRPMILMTNLSAPELDGVLGDRLADRLREVGIYLNFAWPSYRAQA